VTVSYDDLLNVVAALRALPAPWFISGGWSLDLFANGVTREHEDLEIGVRRSDQTVIRQFLSDDTIEKVIFKDAGNEWGPWPEGEWLILPDFQLRVRSRDGSLPAFEFFLNEVVDGEWRFRHDEAIRRPEGKMGLVNRAGIPVMAPELALLHKSGHHREKDEHDFQLVRELLSGEQRTWLRQALERRRPKDPWIPWLG
jgi:hypothetical protein